jgi:hypothetical protein
MQRRGGERIPISSPFPASRPVGTRPNLVHACRACLDDQRRWYQTRFRSTQKEPRSSCRAKAASMKGKANMRYTHLFACAAALGGAVALSGDAMAQSWDNVRIYSRETDRCVTVPRGEGPTVNAPCTTTSLFPRYDIDPSSGDTYTIRSVGREQCLVVNVPSEGVELQLARCAGDAAKWKRFPANGDYKFCKKANDRFYCWQAESAGRLIMLQTRSGDDLQKWQILR